MNLFYKPTLSELYSLIENREQADGNINIVVDNDGEVIVDQSSTIPETKLPRFKFYIDGMNAEYRERENKIRYLKFLNQLYKNLVFCWEKGMTGKVDYTSVSRLQNLLYQKEINSIRKNDYPISINTYR